MSDILSAASLLLAIMTTLYGMYFASINEILDTNVDKHDKANNRPAYDKAKIIWKTKLLPLLLISVCLSAIFLPEFITVISDTIRYFFVKSNLKWKYDTVKAGYCAVTVFMCTLTFNIIIMSFKFYDKRKSLKPE